MEQAIFIKINKFADLEKSYFEFANKKKYVFIMGRDFYKYSTDEKDKINNRCILNCCFYVCDAGIDEKTICIKILTKNTLAKGGNVLQILEF